MKTALYLLHRKDEGWLPPPPELRQLEPEPGSPPCIAEVQLTGGSSPAWARCPKLPRPRRPAVVALATAQSQPRWTAALGCRWPPLASPLPCPSCLPRSARCINFEGYSTMNFEHCCFLEKNYSRQKKNYSKSL